MRGGVDGGRVSQIRGREGKGGVNGERREKVKCMGKRK